MTTWNNMTMDEKIKATQKKVGLLGVNHSYSSTEMDIIKKHGLLNTAKVDVYRAWSADWSKSLTFYGTIINSKHWNKFKQKVTSLLGEGWGWELATNEKISTDIITHDNNS